MTKDSDRNSVRSSPFADESADKAVDGRDAISANIERISSELGEMSKQLSATLSAKYSVAVRFAKVRAAKEERSRRAEYLPAELFAEPGWDILLELYALELVGRSVTERELTERIPVPSTVSIRWMKMLDAHNLVARTVDVVDRTQLRIELTSKALNALDRFFSDKL